jgi:CHAT domain-containing protein
MTRIHDREDQRVAFDNVMLLASIAPDDPLAGPTSHSRWAQMRLALGDGKAAVAAVAEARHQLARLSLPSHPASVPELVRLGQAGDLYLHLADVCRRLGRTGEALDLLGQAVAHALPVVSGSSFNLMVVASRVYAGVDSALATRWADGAAVIADGLRLSSRPGEDRVRFADSALLQQAYDAAIAGHLDSGDLYAAVSMADRSRGRFLFESIGSGDKSISMVEHLTSELTTPADLLPPALGGPANALLSIESVAEGLGVGAAPVIPEGLPRELDTHRSAVLDAVTRECAATRTPVALSPARVAGMSLYLRNVLLVQESGDDLILFLLGVGAGAGAAAADGHGADAASAYVLSQDAVRHVRVPGCRGRLLKAVKTIQRWMGIHESTRWLDTDDEVPTQDAFNSALADLSELIVAPAARYLVPGAELTVIPSRELGLVPWGLLRDPDGRFLLDRYAITIAPSLSILHMLFERGQRQEPAPFRAYIAADPALDREQLILGDLPYAREEARALWSRLETLGAGSCVRRVGPDATAMSYWAEAAGASLVHLAAHAELAYPAELSVIHLSGGGLAAYQVADVPLASAVVFLAACDTGQGRVSADGVLGLGQSFLQAGAQAVILALTQVNDAVTATLADHFYAALLGGTRNTTVASALQSAVLATRSDLEAGRVIQDDEVIQPDPVAWGAFYMLGHPFARLSFDVAKEP